MDEQQAIGIPYRLQWRDKELKLGLIDQNVKAHYVAAFKAVAIREHREYLALAYPDPAPPQKRSAEEEQELAQVKKEFRDEMTAGCYAWGSAQASRWWMQNIYGERTLLGAILEAGGNPLSDDDLKSFLVEKKAEWRALMDAILWDSENPNAQRPTLKETK